MLGTFFVYTLGLSMPIFKKKSLRRLLGIGKAASFCFLCFCRGMQVPESVHFYPKNRPKNSHSSSLEYYNTQLKIKIFHKKHLALSSILLFRDINVHSGTCIPQLKQKDRTYICLVKFKIYLGQAAGAMCGIWNIGDVSLIKAQDKDS